MLEALGFKKKPDIDAGLSLGVTHTGMVVWGRVGHSCRHQGRLGKTR